MPAYNETGHAINVANSEKLTVEVTSFGTAYNPSKLSLKTAQLTIETNKAKAALLDVVSKNTIFNNITNTRSDLFDSLRPLSTRIVNTFIASGATPQKIKDAKVFLRKIQGKRATPIKNLPVNPEAPAPVSISASQQSYTQITMHFAGLLDLVKSEAGYTPNEADLKIAALDAKYADLNAKNTAVLNAHTAVSKARINRDKILYTEGTGIVDNAKLVKTYVKGAFGSTSMEYKKVSAIKFRIVKQ